MFVNREGMAYISFSPSASIPANTAALPHRFRLAVSPISDSVSNTSVQATLPSVTSAFPARPSEERGLLTITIGNVPTGTGTVAPRTITIDFRDPMWTDSSTPQDLINYINTQLNPPNVPDVWNPPNFHPNITYNTANPTRPVATASIHATTGNLVIQAAERSFDISINERQSDRPMFVNPPSGHTGVPQTNTMTVTVGGMPRSITMVPGDFGSADEFVTANRGAFESQGFFLSEEDGRLIITTIAGGEHLTVSPSAVSTFPAILRERLGFGGSEANIYESGSTFEDLDPGAMWIQSGANQGDGLNIEIPRLCARSLGLAMWRPFDETDPFDGFARYSSLGARQYTVTANVSPTSLMFEPRGHSLDVTSHETATNAISVFDNAINIISEERARFGAMQNRLEFAYDNVRNTSENQQASESRIRDTDMASKMTDFTKQNILMQSSTAMLAQANALPQSVLQLLGG